MKETIGDAHRMAVDHALSSAMVVLNLTADAFGPFSVVTIFYKWLLAMRVDADNERDARLNAFKVTVVDAVEDFLINGKDLGEPGDGFTVERCNKIREQYGLKPRGEMQ